jgi:hypothetical protein
MTIMNLTDEDAETAVFLALGAASVCWEDLSHTGVFQSQRCERIGRELIDHLRRLRLMPEEVHLLVDGGTAFACGAPVTSGTRASFNRDLLSCERCRKAEALPAYHTAEEAMRRAIADRCTCTSRDPSLGPLEGHEPGCSLQNTGWLS